MNSAAERVIPTGVRRRAREWLAGVGEHEAIGTMYEEELVRLLENESNEAQWQDLWESATSLLAMLDGPDVDGDNGRSLAKRTANLRAALAALGPREQRTAQAPPATKGTDL